MLSFARSCVLVAANVAAIMLLDDCSGANQTTLPGGPTTATSGSAATIPAAVLPADALRAASAAAGSSAGTTSLLGQQRSSNGAAGEPALSSDAFVDTIGVNTHLWWGAYAHNFSGVQNALTNLGARHIRDGMVWLNWGTGYYDNLNALAKAGIHTTLTTALNQDPAKIAAYVSFIPNSLEAIEGPNEPNVNKTDNSWAAPIRAFQHSIYTAIRSNPANANVSVISSAVAYTDGAYAVLGNLTPYLDAGNIHDYFGGNAPDAAWIAARMTGAAAVSGAKKIVATETGYCTATGNQGVPESVMAKYVPRAFFEQFNAGVTRTLEYELLDDSTNPSEFWNQCGLMRYDLSPKPAYTALKNLIALLRDQTAPTARTSLSYTLLGNTAAVHHTLLQKNDGTLYLAMWLNSSVYDQNRHAAINVAPVPVAMTFGSPVQSLQAYAFDGTGKVTPQTIPVAGNTAQINVTDTVTLYKIVPGSGSGSANVAPVVPNAAAHWSFDDGTGTIAADSVASAGNATFNGNPSWTAGLFGSAVALNPTTSLHAPAGTLDTSQSYSISAWLLLADTTAAHTAITVEGGQIPAFALSYIPGRGFAFTVNGADTTWHGTSIRASQYQVTPVIGTWYHVAATFDKATCQIALYVNGALQKAAPGCTAFRAAGQTHFGSGQWQTWTGAIDEVNFYQRVLSAPEISALAQV